MLKMYSKSERILTQSDDNIPILVNISNVMFILVTCKFYIGNFKTKYNATKI